MKKKLFIRATMDLGEYLFACCAPTIRELGFEPVKLPPITDPNYKRVVPELTEILNLRERDILAVLTQNPDECAGLIYFTDWHFRWPFNDYKYQLPIKKVFWSREDPFHYDIFKPEAEAADYICTSSIECIPQYLSHYGKTTICTPMALAPEIFYPTTPIEKREFDIGFIGNRYNGREVREAGEDMILIPALEWAKENNKKMGVWGKGPDGPDLFTWSNRKEIWESGVYQHETTRLEAADVYRKVKVILSYTSCPDSQTMLPNRLLHAVGSECVVLSQDTPATREILNNSVFISDSPAKTKRMLDLIFSNLPAAHAQTVAGKEYLLEHHTFKERLKQILIMIGEI